MHTTFWKCVSLRPIQVLLVLLVACLEADSQGDLEVTFQKCCTLGTNWGSQGLNCKKFPGPVSGVSSDMQAVCGSSMGICCLRRQRQHQCERGMDAAKSGRDCVVTTEYGGEYHKDCCDGCKLGLAAALLSTDCSFLSFDFGPPWDSAFTKCCFQNSPLNEKPSDSSTARVVPPTNQVTNLCELFPRELCAHVCVSVPGSYRCECQAGFRLMADGKSCQQDDVPDRCKTNNPCAHLCFDTGVAVECSCHSGYQLASDERNCIDINECLLGLDLCDRGTQTCRNEQGSYSCVNPNGSVVKHSDMASLAKNTPAPGSDSGQCPLGYHFNSEKQVCDDINECLFGLDACNDTHRCLNTFGSYTCVRMPVEECPPGYAFNNELQTCLDVDECAEGLDNCNRDKHFCLNTQGAFACQDKRDTSQCPAGYKRNPDTNACEDVDECAENLHTCEESSETCRNTAGAYECDMNCDKGFRYSLAFRMCVDIDECRQNKHDCKDTEECANTAGNFMCVTKPKIVCTAGFKVSTKPGIVCEDVDECAENFHTCKVDEVCVNEIGQYRCDSVTSRKDDALYQCPPGYKYHLVSRDCQDINECEMGIHNCSKIDFEECINTPGGFICRLNPRCPSGYRYHSTKLHCEDVDECAENGHNCRANDRCKNLPGSFHCLPPCRQGYRADPSNPAVCVDIDECQEGLHNCDQQRERCENRDGSFSCETVAKCGVGFRQASRYNCEDVNECEEGVHRCVPGRQTCVNSVGSYWCRNNPECQTGLRKDPYGRCVDIDECGENIHDCPSGISICINSYGSYACQEKPSCPNGYDFSFESRRCEDVDECTTGLHQCTGELQTCVNSVGGYQCVERERCSAGFRYNETIRICEDIDECEERLDTCGHTESCVNNAGSFQCTRSIPNSIMSNEHVLRMWERQGRCPSGYRFDRRRTKCLDVNECNEQRDLCNQETETCINEVGAYRCGPKSPLDPLHPPTTACPSGYQYDDFFKRCIDIDECSRKSNSADDSGPCDSNQFCENTVGSYTCQCRLGYNVDSYTQACVDVNECQMETHTCLPSQRCDNTIGSFQCIRTTSCGTGYTLNAHTSLCEDDDECTLKTHDCHLLGPMWQCRNTPGSFRCERKRCETGMYLSDKGECFSPNCPAGHETSPKGACVDVNECERSNPCKRGQRCVNTQGSYSCQNLINCGSGFESNEYGTQCLDIDECARGLHECQRGQICQNRPGGYVCQCPPGFLFQKDKGCEDIDECTRYSGQVCSINSECQNMPGSYRCICKEGFQHGEDGKTCNDIDECTHSPGICQQICVNMWGSFRCSCDAGFRIGPDNRSCQDIDECEEFKSQFLCVGFCVNEPGSYSCKCPEGYRLAADGRTCQDIDECATGQVCRGENEICLNVRGGYRCHSITCPPKYIKDKEHKKYYDLENSIVCKKACTPSDRICSLDKTHTVTYQFISLPTIESLPAPLEVTRIQAVTTHVSSPLRVVFDIIIGNESGYFDFSQAGRICSLRLIQPVTGPLAFHLKLQMNVLNRRNLLSSRHFIFIEVEISPPDILHNY